MPDETKATKDAADKLFGISPEQRRVFDAVGELESACSDLILAEQGSCGQSDTLRQMIYSAVLRVYGSSWVTDWVRNAMAGAAMGVYEAYNADMQRALEQVRHEQHQADGVKHDDDCEVCVHIEELANV
jgi:hypothetical protein